MAREGINIFAGFDLKAFSTSAQNLERRLKKTGRSLKRVGASITRSITAPVAILGGLAVREFANFEQAMAKVQATTGATADQLSQLTNLSKELGLTTRFTASEVAALELNYSKLGFSVSDITKITEATLQLSLATGEDLAQSAEVAGQTLRGFNLDASEMQRIVDIMANSFSSSALTLERFSVSMGKIAPVANAAGVTIERVVAMQSALVDSGVEASTVGTSLRKIFIELSTSGLSYEQAMKKIRNATNKVAVANELFGNRAFAAAIILSDQQQKVDDLTISYQNSGGEAKRMADIMDDTLTGALFKLKSAVEGLAISFGETLAPGVEFIANKAANVARVFSQLTPITKTTTLVIVGFAAAIGPLLVGIGFLTIAVGALSTVSLVLLPHIIGIAAVVISLGAAFILIKGNLGAFSDFFFNIWIKIKNTLIDSLQIMIMGVNQFLEVFDIKIGEGLIDSLESLKGITRENAREFVGLKQAFKNIFFAGKEVVKVVDDLSKKFTNTSLPSAMAAQGIGKVKKEIIELKDAIGGFNFSKLQANIKRAGRVMEKAGRFEFKIIPVIDVSGLADQVGKLIDETAAVAAAKAKAIGEAITNSINSGLQSLATESLTLLGEFLGQALAGNEDSLKNLGEGLLNAVGGFMTQFGQAMIAIGIAQALIQASIASLNPALAIAGGIALVAAGAAISSISKKGIEGSGGGSAGGFVSSGARGGGSFDTGTIVQEVRINGRDLILVQQRERRMKR